MRRSGLPLFVVALVLASCAHFDSPTPAPTLRSPVEANATLFQAAKLYSGPGNVSYEILRELPEGTPVHASGMYGEFVKVDAVAGTAATGFIAKAALKEVPDGLPGLKSSQVPWEPFFLSRCVPGEYAPEANTVTFATRQGEDSFETESAAWPFQRPVRIRIESLTVTGAGSPSIKVLGVPEGEKSMDHWWEGITRLDIGTDGGHYAFRVFNDSDVAATVVPTRPNSDPIPIADPIQVVFDPKRTASVTVLDGSGSLLQTVDLSPYLPLPGGLFPDGRFFFGTMIWNPDLTVTSMELKGFAVESEPTGLWVANTDLNAYLGGSGLAGLAKGRHLTMGTEFDIRRVIDRRYCQIMERDFNDASVPAFGWTDFWKGRSEYRWGPIDRIVEYANRRGWRVLASHLIWGAAIAIPDWLWGACVSPGVCQDILKEHISTVMTHFDGHVLDGHVPEWSIANEVIERTACTTGRPDEFWFNKLGLTREAYLRLAFTAARKADPDGILILNSAYDFPGLDDCSQETTTQLLDTVKKLNTGGKLVDAIGMQFHLLEPDGTQVPPEKAKVIDTMRQLSQAGVKIYITELEVDIGSRIETKEKNYEFQAWVYRQMMDACLESEVCADFTIWGFADSLSWVIRPFDFPYGLDEPDGDPLIFDKSFLPKPAYFALRDALAGTAWAGGTLSPTSPPPTRDTVDTCLSVIDQAPGGTQAGMYDMYEDFESAIVGRWTQQSTPDTVLVQQGGRFAIAIGGSKQSVGAGLSASTTYPVAATAGMFFEAQVALCPASAAGNISIALSAPLPLGVTWAARCFAEHYSNRLRGSCSDSPWPQQDGHTYATRWQTLEHWQTPEAGKWHTLRMEVRLPTVTYFIDGTQVGSHAPVDAQQLAQAGFTFSVGVWKSTVDRPIVGLVDNVRIGLL